MRSSTRSATFSEFCNQTNYENNSDVAENKTSEEDQDEGLGQSKPNSNDEIQRLFSTRIDDIDSGHNAISELGLNLENCVTL